MEICTHCRSEEAHSFSGCADLVCEGCLYHYYEQCPFCGLYSLWNQEHDCYDYDEDSRDYDSSEADRPDDSASINSLLVRCLKTPSADGQSLALSILRQHYSAVTVSPLSCYASGNVPILLVAHTDTVWDSPPDRLWIDGEVITAPNGLGADDRAGVYAIARLLQQGYRPHVLFTDQEETGGQGAQSAAKLLPAPNVRLMIELDRAGANDAVYYSCDNPALKRWISRRGFTTAIGSFTDISVLMPAWKIAGVNLSIGYLDQHWPQESLNLTHLEHTIDRVARMLKRPPRWPFAYKERSSKRSARREWLPDTLALDLDSQFDWRVNHHRLPPPDFVPD